MREKIGRDYSKLKKCSLCKKEKDLSCYRKRSSAKDGLRNNCRNCDRNTMLLHDYGITLEQFDDMLREQDYKCASCATIWPGGKYNRFAIDHCHKSGKIRGLLCSECNMAVGGLGDTLEGVKCALEYLKRFYPS